MLDTIKGLLCKYVKHRWERLDFQNVTSRFTPWFSNAERVDVTVYSIEQCERCFKQRRRVFFTFGKY